MKLPRFLAAAALAVAVVTAGWATEAQAGPFRYRGHQDPWNHGYSTYSYAPAYVYPAGGYYVPSYGHGVSYYGGPAFYHGGGHYGGYYGGAHYGGHYYGGHYGGGHYGGGHYGGHH